VALVVDPRFYLRRRLETLERATLTIRGIARSLNDSAGLSDELNPVEDLNAAGRVAEVLRELAGALRSYGRLARSKYVDRGVLKHDVDQHLAEARERQQTVADVMRADLPAPSAGWPLRGELVTHLDRLRNELKPPPARPPEQPDLSGSGSWRERWRAAVRRWRQPS
jgi:hypothetical protein